MRNHLHDPNTYILGGVLLYTLGAILIVLWMAK